MAKIKVFSILRADGSEVHVTPNLGDTLNFERTVKRNPRMGSIQDNMLMMQPFRCWSAGKREGTITDTWEEFSDGPNAVLEVNLVDDAAADDDENAVDLGGATGANLDTPTEAQNIF